MSLFEVINSGEFWDVVGVNPNNPTDRVLANRCENQAYAEMLAADLNRIAEIEPYTECNKSGADRRPKRIFLLDMESGEPVQRQITLED